MRTKSLCCRIGLSITIVCVIMSFISCSKESTSPPPLEVYDVQDFMPLVSGISKCKGEFSPEYSATSDWRDSIGDPISVSGILTYPVYRLPYLTGQQYRAYIFIRGDSLFMADSLINGNSFRNTYLMIPSNIVENNEYTVSANLNYLEFGPEGSANTQPTDTLLRGCKLTVHSTETITKSNGDPCSDCLHLTYDYSAILGSTYVVEIWLEKNEGFVKLYFAENGEGAEITECPSNTMADIDGNVYPTVTIGTQVWMAENLKVTHYRNGDPIPQISNFNTWISLTTGAYCNYTNSESLVATYGRLYNWYAASDVRNIAPAGWHVPSDAEWQVLVNFLGGDGTAGGKMKESGTLHWTTPNLGATNESGFSALPAGERRNDIDYFYLGNVTSFWSATDAPGMGGAWYRFHNYTSTDVYHYTNDRRDGFSIRCIKD